jgi:hypothetical protein
MDWCPTIFILHVQGQAFLAGMINEQLADFPVFF